MTLTGEDFPKDVTSHVVQTGETFAEIADTYGLGVADLYQLNAGMLDREAKARGLEHSEGGRIIFPGTILKLQK
jgi:hypothetical protein